MAKEARLKVAFSSKRIEQLIAQLVDGHGIDGEITAREVVNERHGAVAKGGSTTGATGRGILLAGIGMEQNGEVGSDPEKASIQHLVDVLFAGADNHVVAILDRFAQQGISDGASDKVSIQRVLPIFD